MKNEIKILAERLLRTRGEEAASLSKIKETAYILAEEVIQTFKESENAK